MYNVDIYYELSFGPEASLTVLQVFIFVFCVWDWLQYLKWPLEKVAMLAVQYPVIQSLNTSMVQPLPYWLNHYCHSFHCNFPTCPQVDAHS